jgi:hypothetical protein
MNLFIYLFIYYYEFQGQTSLNFIFSILCAESSCEILGRKNSYITLVGANLHDLQVKELRDLRCNSLFVSVNFAGKWEIYDALLVLPGGCEVCLERAG